MKPRTSFWALRQIARHGWPRRIVTTYAGVGDELMTLAAFRELNLRGGGRGQWLLLRHRELAEGSGLRCALLPWDVRYLRIAERLRRPVLHLGYLDYDAAADQDRPLPGHALATFCRQLGLTGEVTLKPYLRLTAAERAAGRLFPRQVVIQNSSLGAQVPMRTKQWVDGRFQWVADRLAALPGLKLIQLGSRAEPPLSGTVDLRDRTSLRQSAAILSQSELFVGLVGGQMHLARAVDCPAVIVYGGRESPALAGYSAYDNLQGQPPCSPCYYRNHCVSEMVCMTAIDGPAVFRAAERNLGRGAGSLPLDRVRLN